MPALLSVNYLINDSPYFLLGMSDVKRESRGTVSSFFPASVCNLFVCQDMLHVRNIYTPRQSVKETYRVQSTYFI